MQKSKDPGLKKSLKGHNDTVAAIDFNPDGSQVASGSCDASLLIWEIKAKQIPYKFIGHTGGIYSVTFNPTGTIIATGSADHTVRLWQNDSRGVSSTIKSHSGPVRACSFSFDGQYLLTGSDDKYLKIFTVNDRKHVSTIAAHTRGVKAAEFSPDSRLIVSCSEDRTVKLWDSEQLIPISVFEDDTSIFSARFHPDGTCLASGSVDGKVQLWDIRSQMMLQLYSNAHNDAVNSLAFHSSGRYLTTASSDSTLKIFDLRKGALMYSLYGHEGIVQTVNYTKDGEIFGSGGSDCNLILWDSNLVDPEQEDEVSKLKKGKRDAQNVDGKGQKLLPTAAEKLRRIQKKRREENKRLNKQDAEKENTSPNLSKPEATYEPLAEDLAGMMDKVASQLDIITRTVVTLEKRIAENEELVNIAYDQYLTHQRMSIARAQRTKEEEEKELAETLAKHNEDGEGEVPQIDPMTDLELAREKAKNIMSIINMSQYSLAAVQKSAIDVRNTTTQLRDDIDRATPTRDLRSTIKEESEDDLERDVGDN